MLWAAAVFALTDLNPPEVRRLVNQGLESTYVNNYAAADSVFEHLTKVAPKNPASYFFRAALDELYMVDCASGSRESSFYRNLDQTARLSREILKREQNAWAYLYLGATYVYRSTYEGWRKRYWACFSAGIKSRAPLEQALKLNPALYDAYLGLGAYEYFAGRTSHYILNLLPFGNIEKGLGWMRLAAERGSYFQVTADNTLVWALAQLGRGKEALAASAPMLARHPNCRVLLWHQGEAYFAAREWQKSIDANRRLLAQVEREQPGNYANVAQLKLRIAQAHCELGQVPPCRRLLDEIRALRCHESKYINMGDTFRQAEALRKRIDTRK